MDWSYSNDKICQKNNVWYANSSLLSVDSRGEFLLPLRTEVI